MVLSVGLILNLTMAAMSPPGAQPQAVNSAEFVTPQTLSSAFSDWTVQSLDLPGEAGEPFSTTVVLGAQAYDLVLEPYSVRSDRFQVFVERNGEMVELTDIDGPKTYRGYVDGVSDSIVGGSLINGQLTVIVDLADDSSGWTIQPLSDFVDGAPKEKHVVYSNADAFGGDYRCGTDDLIDDGGMDVQDPAPHQGNGNGEFDPAGGDKTAELAFDTDFEFYQRRGSNSQNVIDDINNVVAGMDVIYQRDTSICHKITRIIVRDNANDPYTSNTANGLLTQFRNHWNSQQGGVQRDIAHMMTGRSPPGGIIGIAFLSVVCNRSSAYGISWTLFTSNFSLRVGLTAHEVGHNWSAGHCCGSCSGCSTCLIMCPCINGCGHNVTRFGTSSISAITRHRNSRSCLDDGCNGGGGGGPECSDVKKLVAKCKNNGTIKAKVKMWDTSFDGAEVTIEVDGTEMTETINGKKAKFAICCFGGNGHTIVLTDPAGCNLSKTVDCP